MFITLAALTEKVLVGSDIERAERGTLLTILMTFSVTGVIAAGLFVFAEPAVRLFSGDAEVIAAIMAAIAAMGAAVGKQYRLRSVKQVTRRGGRSVWAQAGIQDVTQPF